MDKRRSMRFDKVFPVAVSSPLFGDFQAIARNISSGGMFLEVAEPLPLGAEIQIHFAMPSGGSVGGGNHEIIARGEVKGHYFLNYGDADGNPRTLTGMGVRFLGFDDKSLGTLERSLHQPLH